MYYKYGQNKVQVQETDISTAHPLSTYGEGKGDTIIVKFTRRDIHNAFYGLQKKVTGKKASKLQYS